MSIRIALPKLPDNFRDIIIKPISQRKLLIVGCDSSGAVGSKTGDVVKVDGETVGKFAVRTALMEVMAVNAEPLCVACGLAVEPKPAGEDILKGVQSEMVRAGLNPSRDLVISTEKNFPTIQTGVGVAVVGVVGKDSLLMGKSKEGDIIASVGIPSVGMEVLENERRGVIADLEDLNQLLSLEFVHGVIPVGSKGVLYESKILAKESKLGIKLHRNIPIDTEKSAGPSTVLLASIERDSFELLKAFLRKPVHKIALLTR
ncbi:MAG: hypothetical protein RMJ15_02630 [Nitrososphaerota archaeon]|nr:hypothetical protein [Candidatus Bathyarchaeota archaeon]MDW8022626.1 hypothetical protein [Nitrososphaerota archaeon]